jgi:hypothetical protein
LFAGWEGRTDQEAVRLSVDRAKVQNRWWNATPSDAGHCDVDKPALPVDFADSKGERTLAEKVKALGADVR